MYRNEEIGYPRKIDELRFSTLLEFSKDFFFFFHVITREEAVLIINYTDYQLDFTRF